METILGLLDKHDFRINTKKAAFFQNKIQLLGLDIENDSVSPSNENIEAIKELGTPKTVKQVRGLISSFSYYRKFMKNFVNIAKPIMELLKGKTEGKEKIKWSEECEKAKKELVRQITSKPILQIFDPERDTVLQTDASGLE